MATAIQANDIWLTKKIYEEAERIHYENLAKAALTPLAGEIAKARQRLIESRDTFADVLPISTGDSSVKQLEQQLMKFHEVLEQVQAEQLRLSERLLHVETVLKHGTPNQSTTCNVRKPEAKQQCAPPAKKQEPMEEDDVDLFASDSEEDDAAAKVREERLAAYNAKNLKPALIAKSNVILDVKPWDDETDMKKMEECVRKIEADGLLWGAAKLVPLAYGIHKLQISCVVEDEKVSIDWLTEQLEGLEDYVQSVDIAAFNKI